MTLAARRRVGAVLVVVVLAALAAPAAGCSSSGEATTSAPESSASTEASGATTETTDSNESQQLVVGGKSKQEYEASLPDLEKAVAASPDDLDALQELAIAQYNTERYEEAAATYQKMLLLNDDAFTHNNYANVLRNWKKLDEAEAEYEKAISVDPSFVTAYINLASMLARGGEVTAAIEVLERGLGSVTGEDRGRLESLKAKLGEATASTTTT